MVKRHRPWHRALSLLIIVIIIIASGYGLYNYGRYQGGYYESVAEENIAALEREIEKLQVRNATLIDKNAMLDSSSRIDRNAHDEVKSALNIAQQQSLELREELAFYRSLVSPSEMEPGLHIQSFTLEPDASPSTFNYKLVLTQVRKNNREAVGVVQLRFSGLIGGETVIYALSDIAKVNTEELNFKFRYFQNFEGNLRLPDNFEPKSVSITVKPKGKRLNIVKKSLKWDATLIRSE